MTLINEPLQYDSFFSWIDEERWSLVWATVFSCIRSHTWNRTYLMYLFEFRLTISHQSYEHSMTMLVALCQIETICFYFHRLIGFLFIFCHSWTSMAILFLEREQPNTSVWRPVVRKCPHHDTTLWPYTSFICTIDYSHYNIFNF